MQIIQKSLKVKNYILRGLFSKPDDSYDNIVVMFHGFTGHKNENGYLFKQLKERKIKKLLLIATGALMNSTSSQQGESIPGIAHAISIEI